MILRSLGLDERAFEGFIVRLKKRYMDTGVSPENLAEQLNELYYFLERNQNLSGAASIPQICNDFNVKLAEKESLQNEIAVLDSRKSDSQKELSAIQTQKLIEEAELGLTSGYKEKLRASGLSKDELPHCIDLGAKVKGYGYSIHETVERLSATVRLEDSLMNLRIKNTHEEARNSLLVRKNSNLEEINSKYSQRLREMVALDEMGFGYAELKQLHNFLNEIAEAKGMPMEENAAVKWFFDNLRAHHYDYLDLGKAVKEHRSEIASLKTQRDDQLAALNLTQDVKKVVDSLVKTGMTKNDIEIIPKIIKQIRLSYSGASPDVNNTNNSSSTRNCEPGSSDSKPSELDPNPSGSSNDLKREATIKEKRFSRLQPTVSVDSNLNLNKGKEAGKDVRPQSVHENHKANDIIEFMQSIANSSPNGDPQVEPQEGRVKRPRPQVLRIRPISSGKAPKIHSRIAETSNKNYDDSENEILLEEDMIYQRRVAGPAEEIDAYWFDSASETDENSWQAEKNFILNNIGSFVFEAITKPVLRQMQENQSMPSKFWDGDVIAPCNRLTYTTTN